MIRNQEIAAKVYYYAFISPGKYNVYQMDKKIFGKRSNRVNRTIKSEKLIERGILEIDRVQGEGEDQNVIYARLEPLMSIIERKIVLTNLEKHILKKLLRSNFFRYLIRNINIDINFGLSSLFYIIAMNLDYWSTFYLKNKILITLGSYVEDKLKTIEQYEDLINEMKELFDEAEFKNAIKWFKSYDELVPILKLLEHGQKSHELYEALKDTLFLFFIPRNLMEKIRGISVLGRMDIIFSSLYGEVKNVDIFTEYVLSKIQSLNAIDSHKYHDVSDYSRQTEEKGDMSGYT
ncbi:MAG: hypothetical protein KAW47_01385 [Thermoplasmatales archaeon]|nr:hypothetical protein [Thermoplasmatales archaeon]